MLVVILEVFSGKSTMLQHHQDCLLSGIGKAVCDKGKETTSIRKIQ
jgi:hypothetical protein